MALETGIEVFRAIFRLHTVSSTLFAIKKHRTKTCIMNSSEGMLAFSFISAQKELICVWADNETIELTKGIGQPVSECG